MSLNKILRQSIKLKIYMLSVCVANLLIASSGVSIILKFYSAIVSYVLRRSRIGLENVGDTERLIQNETITRLATQIDSVKMETANSKYLNDSLTMCVVL